MAQAITVYLGTTQDIDLVWSRGDTEAITMNFFDDEAQTSPSDLSGLTFAASLRIALDADDYWSMAVNDASANVGVLIVSTPTGASVGGDTELPFTGRWDVRKKTGASAYETIGRGDATLNPTVTAAF